jgi:hypothetical protein
MSDKKFNVPRLCQIGLVVRDLDEAMKNYREVMGIEPARVIEKSPAAPGKKYYKGKESDFFQRVALYYFGELEFEILQPYGESSALSDYLEEHGPGLHHIAFDTVDFTGFEEHLTNYGINKIQTGPTSRHPALQWGFFDSSKLLGTMIELVNFKEIEKLEEAESKNK